MIPIGVQNQYATLEPVLLWNDTFTDSDGTTLQNHNPDIGTDWSYFNGTQPQVTSNQLLSKGTINAHADMGSADGVLMGTYKQGGTQDTCGPRFRHTSGASGGYLLWQDDTVLRLYCPDTTLSLAESAQNQTLTYCVAMKGNDVVVWKNSEHKFTHTHAGSSANTYHGLRFYTGANIMWIDDIQLWQLLTTPLQIPGCILWLDANEPGGVTNQWSDKSGAGNHFTAATAGNMPTIAAGVATFDGTSDYLSGPSGMCSGLTSGEIFIRQRRYSDASESGTNTGWMNFGSQSGLNDHFAYVGAIYSDFGSTARQTIGDPTPSLADWATYNLMSSSSGFKASRNGDTLLWNPTNTVGWQTVPTFGKSEGAYYFQGDVKEIIMFNRSLSMYERALVEMYLWNT